MNVTKAVSINHVRYGKDRVFISARLVLIDEQKKFVATIQDGSIDVAQTDLVKAAGDGNWGDAEVEAALRAAMTTEGRLQKVVRQTLVDGVLTDTPTETTELVQVTVPRFLDITDIIWE